MRRGKSVEKLDDLGWKFVRSIEWKHNGRLVERGTEISIVKNGRMKFLEHVVNSATGAEWINCVDKNKAIRSFRPEEVKRVHYKNKLRG
jgi:hypothetical protein